MKTLASYNIKGGVGKTSTAVNLAALAAAEGWRTLLWDLDPQGAATYLFRIRPRVKGGAQSLISGRRDVELAIKSTDVDGLDLLPADFSYRHMDLALDDAKRPDRRLRRILAPLAAEYDLVVLDCPPSASLVSEAIFTAADLLLVPLIPAPLSARTYDQLTEFVDTADGRRPLIRAFFSMVDGRKRLHAEMIRDLRENRDTILAAAVPASAEIERMGLRREPVVVSAPRSPAAAAYAALWQECRPLVT
ncbi:MAG: AAA family ATPase [Frankiaceae bacterium]